MDITLPDNCYGLESYGRKFDADKRGHVDLPDDVAASAVKTHRGLISAPAFRLATRRGRRCTACRFLAQVWSTSCPRCGGETQEET